MQDTDGSLDRAAFEAMLVDLDGVITLPGEPDPTMFGRAARLPGADPARSMVVDDASSGVAAGPAGRFGLVLRIDRGGNRQALLAAGADLVVDDLAETLQGVAGVKWGGEDADRLERNQS